MRAYFNMPLTDFVQQLRTAAIANNAGPIIIDLLDQLDAQPTVEEKEAEIEKVSGELYDMERQRDDLREELSNLFDAISDFSFTDEQADDPALERAKKAATDALERHK